MAPPAEDRFSAPTEPPAESPAELPVEPAPATGSNARWEAGEEKGGSTTGSQVGVQVYHTTFLDQFWYTDEVSPGAGAAQARLLPPAAALAPDACESRACSLALCRQSAPERLLTYSTPLLASEL